MAKVVVFSDLHAHTFAPYSTVLEDGTNSRLQDALNVIAKVREVAQDVDADAVFFTGDLFQERRHIVTQAFTKVYEAMSMFVLDRMPLLMLHGNHDQADRLGRHHALSPFSSFATVVDNAGWLEFKGRTQEYAILAVPYIEDGNTLQDAINSENTIISGKDLPHIFLGHFGVQGAQIGADFVYSNGSEPGVDDLPSGQFDVGFLGHFHMHQQLTNNFWYVGAPMQHNWGDKGQERGCMVYDTESKEAEHVPFNITPKFVEMAPSQLRRRKLATERGNGNIVRVVSSPGMSEEELDEAKEYLGAKYIELQPSKDSKDEAHEIRLKVESGASWDDMAAEYVKSGLVDLDGMDPEWLVEMGRKILSKVSS